MEKSICSTMLAEDLFMSVITEDRRNICGVIQCVFYIDQTNLEFTMIFLCLSPEC